MADTIDGKRMKGFPTKEKAEEKAAQWRQQGWTKITIIEEEDHTFTVLATDE